MEECIDNVKKDICRCSTRGSDLPACRNEIFTQCKCQQECKFGNFRESLLTGNFAYAKFRENKILAKWQNHSVDYRFR